MYISRELETKVRLALQNNPVVSIIGPRQCGKSTLAKHLSKENGKWIYLDLEKP